MYIELKKLNEQPNPTPKVAKKKKCDEIFAAYINFIKEKAKQEYCVRVIIFCLLYRECLNKLADRLEQEKEKVPEKLLMQEDVEESEYCLKNNAEQMPDISNDFIVSCLKDWKDIVDIEEMKELTLHFCKWIFYYGYTCSLITMHTASPGVTLQFDAAVNPQNREEEEKNISNEVIKDVRVCDASIKADDKDMVELVNEENKELKEQKKVSKMVIKEKASGSNEAN